jgi:hypothetical protein
LVVCWQCRQLDSKSQNLIRLLRHLRIDPANILDRQRRQSRRPLPFFGLNIRHLASVRESRFSAGSVAAAGEVGTREAGHLPRARNVVARGIAAKETCVDKLVREKWQGGRNLRRCSRSRERTGCRIRMRQCCSCSPFRYRGWYPRSRILRPKYEASGKRERRRELLPLTTISGLDGRVWDHGFF